MKAASGVTEKGGDMRPKLMMVEGRSLDMLWARDLVGNWGVEIPEVGCDAAVEPAVVVAIFAIGSVSSSRGNQQGRSP